ncbi:hypothetical protein Tco_0746045, partial [Tanacetum coccineum]
FSIPYKYRFKYASECDIATSIEYSMVVSVLLDSYCYYKPDFDSFQGAWDWACTTLIDHVLINVNREPREGTNCRSFNNVESRSVTHGSSYSQKDNILTFTVNENCRFQGEYMVVYVGCLAKINPDAPLDKVCLAATLNGSSVAGFGLGIVGLAQKPLGRLSLNPQDYKKPVHEVIAEMTMEELMGVWNGWGVAVFVDILHRYAIFKRSPLIEVPSPEINKAFYFMLKGEGLRASFVE